MLDVMFSALSLMVNITTCLQNAKTHAKCSLYMDVDLKGLVSKSGGLTTRKFHNNLVTILIMHNWGFGCVAKSLEEHCFASIDSPDNENAKLWKHPPESSSVSWHDLNMMDVRKCDFRSMVEWVWKGEGKGRKETGPIDAVNTLHAMDRWP